MWVMRKVFTTLASIAVAGMAGAQVGLPPVQLPQLPAVQLPIDIGKTASEVTGALDARPLIELRPLRIRKLLRAHQELIEADPRGEPIVRAEVLAFSPAAAA